MICLHYRTHLVVRQHLHSWIYWGLLTGVGSYVLIKHRPGVVTLNDQQFINILIFNNTTAVGSNWIKWSNERWLITINDLDLNINEADAYTVNTDQLRRSFRWKNLHWKEIKGTSVRGHRSRVFRCGIELKRIHVFFFFLWMNVETNIWVADEKE